DLDVLQQAIDQYDLGYKKEIRDDINFLVRQGRCDTLEVCAPPTSALAQAVIDQGGLAFRAGVHDGFDMATKSGVRRLALWMRQHRKVQKARRIQAGCETLFSIGLQRHGTGVDLEQPQRSQSWSRSASLQRIKEQTYEALVSGCGRGLRCPRSGLLLPEVWKICTADPELQKAIGKRCSNRPGRHDNHERGEIIGGKDVQIYTDIARGDDVEPHDQAKPDEQIYTDIAGDDDVEHDDQVESDDELDGGDGQELVKDGGHLSTGEEQEIGHRLSRLHRNLGHPSARTMVKILKNSGASLQVLKMAKNFKCHACNSSVLPKAVRTAAGIEIPEVFEVKGSDGLEWPDPKDDAIYLLTLDMDEGSRLALVTNRGDKSQRPSNWSAADVVETWRSWADHYRAPRPIRCDAEGCHRAELTKGWRSSRGIDMFIAPGEAHWLTGKVERRIQLFKRTLIKFRKQNYDCDVDEAISQVIDAINDLDKVGGHSPYAHAFGIGGALGSSDPFAIADDGSGESRGRRRLNARQSFIEVEYSVERAVVELTNMEKRGASMSDLMEVARRGTFEDLTSESRPAIQRCEPQTAMPPETQARATAGEPMEDEASGLEADVPGPYFDTKGRGGVDQANSEGDLFIDVNTLKESGLAGFEFVDENMTVYFEMLEPELTVKDPADVIRCRWVLPRKADGTAKGDVTSAFLQAYDLKKDLFVEADEALSPAFGVQPGEALQVMKPGYGMGEAPRKWRLTVMSDFAKLGLQAAMRGIKNLYTWGTWEGMEDGPNSIEQCGVTIESNEKGFFQHQRAYIDKLKEITPKYPKARSDDKLTEADQTWVADVQSKIPDGDYKLFTVASNISKMVKANQNDGILIFRHALPGCQNGPPDFCVYTWCAAAWASRPGGHSQGGHVTALSYAETPFHDVTNFTFLDWGSRKLKRVASSSLAAEIQEASDAEGEQMMVRLVLYEVFFGTFDLHNRQRALQEVPATLVTDCKAFNVLHAFLKHQRTFDETNELDHSQAKEILESRKRDHHSTKQTASGGAKTDMLELISFPPV
ncbi:unnamed protein product, partial [Prorocentrum cordatum]